MNRKTFLIVSGILMVVAIVGIPLYLEGIRLEPPESVDTPPLGSLPRDLWPEHGLDAVERGIIWGQCGACGFPVTIEDIESGFGDIIWMGGDRLPWGEFSCYRHNDNFK